MLFITQDMSDDFSPKISLMLTRCNHADIAYISHVTLNVYASCRKIRNTITDHLLLYRVLRVECIRTCERFARWPAARLNDVSGTWVVRWSRAMSELNVHGNCPSSATQWSFAVQSPVSAPLRQKQQKDKTACGAPCLHLRRFFEEFTLAAVGLDCWCFLKFHRLLFNGRFLREAGLKVKLGQSIPRLAVCFHPPANCFSTEPLRISGKPSCPEPTLSKQRAGHFGGRSTTSCTPSMRRRLISFNFIILKSTSTL